MPWKEASVMDQRIAFVLEAQRANQPFVRLCKAFGITPPTGYLWCRRAREAGSVTALAERSRRPRTSPHQTPTELEEAVVALRQRYGWGARKLRVLLAEQGSCLPEVTINRILKRRGLVRTKGPQGQALLRFERARCNELLQMDLKGEYPVAEGKCYPLSLLDDHSRYLVGLWALARPTGELVQQALTELFRRQGVPEALLLDHGSPWWGASNGHGLTQLSIWLIRQGIRLIYGQRGHPQTQGKVERFHRTLAERTQQVGSPATQADWERWVQAFRTEYNERRPHEALGLRPPVSVYAPVNLRPYLESPPDWDYGAASTARLNTQGCLDYGGRRYFVCEALAGERVRLDRLEDLLLVTFRTTTIREIQLATGRTKAVVLSAFE
jgi:transposase InsO family protein